MKTTLSRIPALLLGAVFTLSSLCASAGVITSQAQLTTILGANKKVENFEGKAGVESGQLFSTGTINSTNSLWLTQAGVDYSNSLFRNDNNYFGLQSRTLGDSANGRSITITFTVPTTDFGFDMQGYSGYLRQGVISVYGTDNQLLSTTNVNGSFFGWEHMGGIGRVTVSAAPSGYIMIDNLGFGRAAAAVPEPASLALLAFGLFGLAAARRRKI